jgi:hypothetical protein
MQTSDQPRITLRQLAEQILALPPEQQEQDAYYHMRDDRGYDSHEPIFGIEVDAKGEAGIEGIDQDP